MRRVTASLALALAASGLLLSRGSLAADSDAPVWEKAPDRSDWAKAYPAKAAEAGVAGDVKMRCSASAAGLLQDCAVISETPTGQGFGAAALSLAAGMELKPTTAGGKSVAGMSFIVPVKFEPKVLKGQTTVTEPEWVRRPTVNELYAYYPAQATDEGGSALVHCYITDRGLMQGCTLKEESPAGHGYGAAALAMTGLFVMRPMTVDGQPVGGGAINVPIKWGAGSHLEGVPGTSFRVLTSAAWIAAPSAAEMAAVYPKSAIGRIASAHVIARCQIRNDGSLFACDEISELPKDHGFAHAADTLTKRFRMPSASGSSYHDLRVDVPFDFRDPSRAAPPIEVGDPIWIQQVKPDAIVKLFPEAATKAGVKVGRASVECSVAADGKLTGCAAVTEDPAGYGFGDAALVVAGVMQMSPWTRQGAPVEGAKIVVPIKLVQSPDAPAPAAPSAKP